MIAWIVTAVYIVAGFFTARFRCKELAGEMDDVGLGLAFVVIDLIWPFFWLAVGIVALASLIGRSLR